MKEFKTKIKYDFSEALVQIIDDTLHSIPRPDPDEQLFLAGLTEVSLRLKKKMVEWRPKYQITFSPVQALALRMLYTDCLGDASTGYAANHLRMIANQIHQHYS